MSFVHIFVDVITSLVAIIGISRFFDLFKLNNSKDFSLIVMFESNIKIIFKFAF